VGEGVLEAVSQLKSFYVAQTVLDVGVNDQLGQAEDFATQVESVSKTRFLALLGGEGLYRLKIEIVVQVKVVQVLPVDQKVEHVETLAADLKTSLNPV